MKKALAIIFFLSANYVFAQDTTATYQAADTCDKIFTIVEEMPRFPGKTGALDKFIIDNLKYPRSASEFSGEQRVYVTFVVTKDGSIKNPKIIRGISKELDEEALRVVKLMPRWEPGMQNGKQVCVQYVLPIKFVLK